MLLPLAWLFTIPPQFNRGRCMHRPLTHSFTRANPWHRSIDCLPAWLAGPHASQRWTDPLTIARFSRRLDHTTGAAWAPQAGRQPQSHSPPPPSPRSCLPLLGKCLSELAWLLPLACCLALLARASTKSDRSTGRPALSRPAPMQTHTHTHTLTPRPPHAASSPHHTPHSGALHCRRRRFS